MIKVENIETCNWSAAIRGARNAMNSWSKSDSYFAKDGNYVLGPNDLSLVKNLYRASLEGDNHAHRKLLRCIVVSMDIIAPLYWWKEFDTYKVGTVSNSCSTMHRIHAKEMVIDDFSYEHLSPNAKSVLDYTIQMMNDYRKRYLQFKDKDYWWQMIQLLPSSYNQKRTITMNYENIVTIIKQRSGHKLDEWNDLIAKLKELPYITEIMGE